MLRLICVCVHAGCGRVATARPERPTLTRSVCRHLAPVVLTWRTFPPLSPPSSDSKPRYERRGPQTPVHQETGVNIFFSLSQSLSGSLHNVAEDFSSSTTPSSPSLSSSSCSSSHPDLSPSALALSPESSSSSCSPQPVLPVYNKQVADLCIIRVSVECVQNGNVYKSILVRRVFAVRSLVSELF